MESPIQHHIADIPHTPDTNGNGVLGKLSKISPTVAVVITMALGGVGAFYVSQQNTAVTESRMDVKLTALETTTIALQAKVDKVLQEVVPRSEHYAIADKQREIDRLLEKMLDERENHHLERERDLQRQLDEIRSRSGR